MKTLEQLKTSPSPWNMPRCCLSEGFVWGGDGRAVCHISGKPSDTYKAMQKIANSQDPTIGYTPPSAWNDYADPKKQRLTQDSYLPHLNYTMLANGF